KQGMGENVEDYAKRFKRIMRKVNYTNGLVDGVQVNYFIKGLNPLYIAQVLMAALANLNASVTQAKLLETGTQIAGLSVTEITNNKRKKGNKRQNNYRKNWRNNACNNCERMGHMERECYQNQTCQRCGKQGHTQQICRNTISRINYTDYNEWDNNDKFYDEN